MGRAKQKKPGTEKVLAGTAAVIFSPVRPSVRVMERSGASLSGGVRLRSGTLVVVRLPIRLVVPTKRMKHERGRVFMET